DMRSGCLIAMDRTLCSGPRQVEPISLHIQRCPAGRRTGVGSTLSPIWPATWASTQSAQTEDGHGLPVRTKHIGRQLRATVVGSTSIPRAPESLKSGKYLQPVEVPCN